MLIAIGSVKGSPGATTLALALAARWPAPGATVVEADPAGGSAAAWFGLCREPGLAAFATAAARGTTPDGVTAFAQRLPVDAAVVLGPAADEAPQTVALLAGRGLGILRECPSGSVVIVDVGRLDRGSPALPIVAAADVVLALVRGSSLDAVDALYSRRPDLMQLAPRPGTVRVVPVGDCPYSARDLASTLSLPILAEIPDDPRGAGVLGGRLRTGRGWTRLPLLRAARSVARSLLPDPSAPSDPHPALATHPAPGQGNGQVMGQGRVTDQTARHAAEVPS